MPPRPTLFAAPSQFLWCTTAGNLRLESWLREGRLSYSRFWGSFLNFCTREVQRAGNPNYQPKGAFDARRDLLPVLRSFPTQGEELVSLVWWYHDFRYVRGEMGGEVNLDGDAREIIRGQNLLYRRVFNADERAAHQGPSRPAAADSNPLPGQDRTVTRRQKKIARRRAAAAAAAAAASGPVAPAPASSSDASAAADLVKLGEPSRLGAVSSIGLALPVVSAAAAAAAAAGSGGGDAAGGSGAGRLEPQRTRDFGNLTFRGRKVEEEDGE